MSSNSTSGHPHLLSRSEYASSPPRRYSSLYGESHRKEKNTSKVSEMVVHSREEWKSVREPSSSDEKLSSPPTTSPSSKKSTPCRNPSTANFVTKITLRKRIPDNQNPPKRKGHTLTEWKNKIYLFGGYQGFHSNDLWCLESNKWKKIEVAGVLPHKRSSHSAVIYKNHLVIFGGDKGDELLNDIWILDLTKEVEEMRWKKIVSKNIPPKPRYAHSAVVMNEKMIVFAGYGGEYLNDMFEFDFKTLLWSQIHNFLSPPARCHFTSVVLPEHNLLVVYGGSNGESLNDVWVYDGKWTCIQESKDTSWLNNACIPSPRSKHAAVKISSNTLLVYGGMTGLFKDNVIWTLTIFFESEGQKYSPIWKRVDLLVPENFSPRDSHAICMSGKELIIFGGYGETSYLNDIWGGEVVISDSTNSSFSSLQELNLSRISEPSITVDDELANEIIQRLNGMTARESSISPIKATMESAYSENLTPTRKAEEEAEKSKQESLEQAFQKIQLLEETVIELSDMVQQLAVSLANESKKRSNLQKEVSTLKQALHNLTYSINI